MNMIDFPNLEKYSIENVIRFPVNQNIYIGFNKDTKKTKIILIYNMQRVDYLNRLYYFDIYRLNMATSHHNLVNLYEIGETYQGATEYMYLILDYDYIRLKGLEDSFCDNMTIENMMKTICQALDGLSHTHYYNVIHRNITSNCILYKNNETKLSNFHLLIAPGYFTKDDKLTLLSYKSPEFFHNKNSINYLIDIYSIGMVLFRCVNQFYSWIDVIKQVDNLEKQVKTSNLINYIGYKNHVSNEVKAIINKACSNNPNNIYSSVLELKRDLENVFDIRY